MAPAQPMWNDEPGLPLDPDLPGPFDVAAPAARWPWLRPDVLAVVFVGGCAGGLLRYAATTAWPAPTFGFPWSTLLVNTVGAFILAVVVVVAAELAPSRYLRPLVGTGFCGALTTFSSVVVTADRLAAHDATLTAAGYVLATVATGLTAAALGLALARVVATRRRDERHGGLA